MGGFSIPPTRDKSGREFAPQHKKGISKKVKGVNMMYRKKGQKKRG